MKATSKEMRKAYKKIDINEVEDVTDDLADLMEDADEINEVGVVAGPDPGFGHSLDSRPSLLPSPILFCQVLGRSYGAPDIDEADLDAGLF